MIDETRAPATAEWARKNARVLRDNHRLREVLEAIAVIEAEGLDLKAKATIGENALRRLQMMMPKDPQRDLLTPVDLRTKLAEVKAEVDESLQAIREIR